MRARGVRRARRAWRRNRVWPFIVREGRSKCTDLWNCEVIRRNGPFRRVIWVFVDWEKMMLLILDWSSAVLMKGSNGQLEMNNKAGESI